MDSLVGNIQEYGFPGVMRSQDLLHFLRIHLRGVDAVVVVPGSVVVLIQVVAAYPGAVALEVGVVVAAAQERAEEGVEPPLRGHALPAIEPQVPLAHHVRGVPDLLELLR